MNKAVVRGKRVLLVDDEASVRQALRMLLECDGHAVTEAADGVEAISLFAADDYDLVATDFDLPVMRGNALAGRIRKMKFGQPIVMITGCANAAAESKGSVDCVLHKPLLLGELRKAIAKVLSG